MLARLALQAVWSHAWTAWITALDNPDGLGLLRWCGVHVHGGPGLDLHGLWYLVREVALGAQLVLVDGLDCVEGSDWASGELVAGEAARIVAGAAKARGFAAAATCRVAIQAEAME